MAVLRHSGSGRRPDPGPSIAVVDDDPDFRALVLAELEEADFQCVEFPDGPSCLGALEKSVFDAILLDMSMPGMDGIETLRRIHEFNPFIPVVMLTADGSVDLVVQTMRAGASDYLVKPPGRERIQRVLREVLERAGGAAALARPEAPGTAGPFEGMFGRSAALQRVFQMMARTAAAGISVLIRGESGTGKELVARGIHVRSARSKGPFVAFNAAAIPVTLIEAELFGHEKGAFTGAQARRVGKIERADGGTLFLDEVGELPLAMQAKLLRVVQERAFQRLGGNELIHSDFRLVTATHRDLPGEVRAGRFREDLYFRIAVFELEVPPLR